MAKTGKLITKLLTQVAPENQLYQRLKPALADATRVFIAVSFATDAGVDHLAQLLERPLKNGRPIDLYLSGYLGITPPSALRSLMNLSIARPSLHVYFNGHHRFHAKFLLVDMHGSFTAYVGSSNLSEGGFAEDGEVNVEVKGGAKSAFLSDARTVQENIRARRDFKVLDDPSIGLYEAWRGKRKNQPRPKAEARAGGAASTDGSKVPLAKLRALPVYATQVPFSHTEDEAIHAAKPRWTNYCSWWSPLAKLKSGDPFLLIELPKRRKRSYHIARYIEHDSVEGAGKIARLKVGSLRKLSELAGWLGVSERWLLETSMIKGSKLQILEAHLAKEFVGNER